MRSDDGGWRQVEGGLWNWFRELGPVLASGGFDAEMVRASFLKMNIRTCRSWKNGEGL